MPANNSHPRPSSAAGRAVHTRRIAFTFDQSAPSRRHFVAGDIAMSHLVALLSGFFPSGEEFFIQSVRRYDRQIADPVLKRQVAGFIGQEMTHGIQHRELNAQLVRRGYWATGLMDRVGTRLVKRMKQNRDRLPDTVARSALAVTAGVEHLTAILGEQVLSVPWIQRQLTDPEVRAMLNWHAIEEMEHKSVAFDVYRYVGGSEPMRIAAMVLTLGLFLSRTVILLASIATDPWAWRHPGRTLRSLATLPHTPLFAGLGAKIRCYLRPGFHPDDIDHGPLLEAWRDEYFGPEGILLDHLK
ncbi:metal-dependent hydrolase [Mycobacteroides immunogenum]|uniref:Metal-dependent hydrolase n=1 Tax=Mycobacteroides immunogenum TaxID=83262 RepID=A0A7V8LRC9_9MYCO|nr:metal-dependent hydrolase [Mycobacteroides immunogenum]AMT70466.1 metal-dependent hydrolase [Mycobacteroides immunogenum]ANO03535.1 metal-dependent hydrolase [Mycobacteroides immunogenum]KIU42001.1 metal-dependent hydrolase [Mycobacteroides immunogenum]KPG13554.1 metal-dependent hydrolase [Mycobacteroides immunogenum]KPG14525.1 metal-dependent hydrolase [Mycobacteroides immunogenum]